jgi:hypothetical protein
MSFAFHIEVAIGVGKPDDAATADAEPNQAVTAQRVNVDPKCEFALYRRPPAASSANFLYCDRAVPVCCPDCSRRLMSAFGGRRHAGAERGVRN